MGKGVEGLPLAEALPATAESGVMVIETLVFIGGLGTPLVYGMV